MNNETETLHQPENFQAELDAILSRQLTPEVIDTYASDALNDLVGVTERIIISYDSQPTVSGLSQTHNEDLAFGYFKLENLEKTLDYVADLAEKIDLIDKAIANATKIDGIVVPPGQYKTEIQPADGSFESKNIYHRLKTILFILEQDFNVSIDDPRRLSITNGGIEGIMRNSSYSLISVPEIERTILVCDEEGNVTYIFDTMELYNVSLSNSDLSNMTKDELNELIKTQPGIGKRIRYSKSFISNIKTSIGQEIPEYVDSEEVEIGTDVETGYLKPVEKAPDDYLNATGIANKLGLAKQTVDKAISLLSPKLGHVIEAVFYSRRVPAYSPEQIYIIEDYFIENNKIQDTPPEGFLSIRGIAISLLGNNNNGLIQDAVDALDKEGRLGLRITAKFGPNIVDAFSPLQQKVIKDYVTERGALLEKAPDDYLSSRGVANKLESQGTKNARGKVASAIDRLGDRLGPVEKFKFGAHRIPGYSPEKQSMIIDEVNSAE